MSEHRPEDSPHSLRRLMPKMLIGGLILLAIMLALHLGSNGIPLH